MREDVETFKLLQTKIAQNYVINGFKKAATRRDKALINEHPLQLDLIPSTKLPNLLSLLLIQKKNRYSLHPRIY